MLTVNGIPEDYPKKVAVVISNKDFNVVARAFIILTYLLNDDDVLLAAENTIHLWYSAFIPKSLDNWIRGPLHDEIRAEYGFEDNIERLLADKISDVCTLRMYGETADVSKSISLKLRYTDWRKLLRYLERELNREEAKSARNAVVSCESRLDSRERYLFRQPPAERPCHVRFREEGVLLPMGRPLHDMVEPNVTLFDFSSGVVTWLLDDTKGPERGWSRSEFKKASPGYTKNDIYGKLFYYLRSIITTFHARMRTLNIEFRVEHDSLHRLKECFFDRILLPEEDTHSYVVPPGIKGWPGHFLNLLNPSATIIAPYRIFPCRTGKMNTHDNRHEFIHILLRHFKLKNLPKNTLPILRTVDPLELQIIEMAPPFKDINVLFEKNLCESHFRGAWEGSNILKKRENTIVKPWPYFPGVKSTPGAESTVEDDQDLFCEDRYPAICYTEWD
ncbi:hypothetical protein F5Y00DRAFT_262234 [Daldinia vernicosa]|uniref:uncharacterized protein n=1 Tax=Daldinia vernicosa TaxID=114800 RepID=UPI0020086D35|nr:uncharacterized protein F5Y00DRAFT_262234 [Daldinia vernicosa]KAI0848766.1 hypothetical protein F5Y00DRAFT_262234 [Daldinia vernicosa]